jgi:hypothetical protein
MTPYHLIASLSVIGAILGGPIRAETPAENALLTRYITLISYGLKNAKGEQLAQYRQEPLILGQSPTIIIVNAIWSLPRSLEILLRD